jgi:hypothetical protein
VVVYISNESMSLTELERSKFNVIYNIFLKRRWAGFMKRRLLFRIGIGVLVLIVLCSVAFAVTYQHSKAIFTKAGQLMAEADTAVINETGQYDAYEKVAINRFIDLFGAYNAKDFNRVKQIDLRTKNVTDTPRNRFLATMSAAEKFTLHFVGISYADPELIAGRFLYSYETTLKGHLGKTIPLAIENFILLHYLDSWWVVGIRPYHSKERGLNFFRYTAELKEKSQEKYGVEDFVIRHDILS